MELIERYARARTPIIQLVTHEERRAIVMLREVSKRLGDGGKAYDLLVWSFTKGLVKWSMNFVPGKGNFWKDEKVCDADPGEILAKIIDWDTPALFVLLDYHPFMKPGTENGPLVIRGLRDLSRVIQDQQKTVVLLQPVRELPPDLEKEMPIIELEMPQWGDIQARLAGLVKRLKDVDKYKIDLDEAATESLIRAGQGLTLSEFDMAVTMSLTEFNALDVRAVELVKQVKKDIIRKNGILEYMDPDAKMADVGGLEILKGWAARRKKAFTNAARAFGLPVPKGALLLGPPGTGKSLVSKSLSEAWDLPLIRLDVGAVFGGLVGESEQNMRSVLKTVEAVSPCVLWIDEVEKGLAGMGGGGNTDGGTAQRVFSTLLTWMNEKKELVFVIATANNISALPPELLRKGRFDEIFFVDLPNPLERRKVVEIHLKKRGRNPADFDVESVVDATNGFSGAEIEAVVVEALYAAFDENEREPTTQDLIAAAKTTVPLSKTRADELDALREWAKERARPVSAKYDPSQDVVPTAKPATLPKAAPVKKGGLSAVFSDDEEGALA